jgi:hypothetical protein
MKQIIQDQTISFDTHQAGDRKAIEVSQLHMHKRMNGKKFKGVDIKIPLDPDQPISFGNSNSDIGKQIINEIKRVFDKDPKKVREMAKYIANQISRYSADMTPQNSKSFFENGAKAIAKHFELNEKIEQTLTQQIKNRLAFYITAHHDSEGNIFYIKQDVNRKRIKMSDDVEKLFFGNGKYK